jgi:hypothetical protein
MSRVSPNLNANDLWICIQRRITEGESGPKCLAKRHAENERKKAEAAREINRLPKRGSKSYKSERLYDHMATAVRNGGRVGFGFWNSEVGKACIKALHRVDDKIATAELRRRGVSDRDIKRLKQSLFEHVRNKVADRLLGRLRPNEKRISKALRSPSARKQLIDRLAGTSDMKQRLRLLKSYGVVGKEARAIASSPRSSDARLKAALTKAENDLDALMADLKLTGQSAKVGLSTFSLLDREVNKLRAEMGVPKNGGSFASNAVDGGLREARDSLYVENLYKKFLAKVVGEIASKLDGNTGAITGPMRKALEKLPELCKAIHERRLAETAYNHGLVDWATVETARKNERAAKREHKSDVAKSLLEKAIGNVAGKALKKIIGKQLESLSKKVLEAVLEQADKAFRAGYKLGKNTGKLGIATHEATR